MTEVLPEGSYVEIERVLLAPDERAPNLPADTARTPYVLRLHGFLAHDGRPGDHVRVRSLIGRVHGGTLLGPASGYDHSFGPPVVELIGVGLHDVGCVGLPDLDLAEPGPTEPGEASR